MTVRRIRNTWAVIDRSQVNPATKLPTGRIVSTHESRSAARRAAGQRP